jgi:energy-coupling factor transport system substrate-specific component
MKKKSQKLKSEFISKENSVGDKDNIKEKLALLALQKQLQVLRFKKYLLLVSFISIAAFGRVLMQSIPSVEPLTFFAMLSGWLFGKKKGFLVGASSLYLSNFFVFGGQGYWTIFQALGFGIAGFFGGFLHKNANKLECFMVALFVTLIFEIIMNISSLAFMPYGIFISFLLGLPFLLIHVVSNSIFSLLLPRMKSYIEKTGKFNEREICLKLADEFHKKIFKQYRDKKIR